MPDTLTDWDMQSQTVLQPYLMAGESVLWVGRPLRRIIFHQFDWFAIPFSLLWGGFALFWEWGVSGPGSSARNSNAATGFMQLWGIPFVLAGQYIIWGRFVYDYWRKGRIYYALTNRRVLVVLTGVSRKLIEAPLHALDSMDVSVRGDGIGSIRLRNTNLDWSGWKWSGRGASMQLNLDSLAFLDIENAQHVYQLIRDQREQVLRRS